MLPQVVAGPVFLQGREDKGEVLRQHALTPHTLINTHFVSAYTPEALL